MDFNLGNGCRLLINNQNTSRFVLLVFGFHCPLENQSFIFSSFSPLSAVLLHEKTLEPHPVIKTERISEQNTPKKPNPAKFLVGALVQVVGGA